MAAAAPPCSPVVALGGDDNDSDASTTTGVDAPAPTGATITGPGTVAHRISGAGPAIPSLPSRRCQQQSRRPAAGSDGGGSDGGGGGDGDGGGGQPYRSEYPAMHVLAPPFQLQADRPILPFHLMVLARRHIGAVGVAAWDVTARAVLPMLAHIGVAGGGAGAPLRAAGEQLNAAIAGQQPAPVAHSHGVARLASVALPRSNADTQAASS